MKPFRPMWRTSISMTHPQNFATLHATIANPDQRLAINLLKLKGNVLERGGTGKRKTYVGLEGRGRAIMALRKRLRQTSQTP